ncbi:unnamed protein product, partial [Amoebophrya sp. A25]
FHSAAGTNSFVGRNCFCRRNLVSRTPDETWRDRAAAFRRASRVFSVYLWLLYPIRCRCAAIFSPTLCSWSPDHRRLLHHCETSELCWRMPCVARNDHSCRRCQPVGVGAFSPNCGESATGYPRQRQKPSGALRHRIHRVEKRGVCSDSGFR